MNYYFFIFLDSIACIEKEEETRKERREGNINQVGTNLQK